MNAADATPTANSGRLPDITEDTLKERVREIPLLDRLIQCRDRLGKMCSERRGPRMCIPVSWDDDDFFIATTLEDAADALRHNDEMRDRHLEETQPEKTTSK